MDKKYLTFLSAILIATISACGGSPSRDAPRYQDESKSDPAPQPDPAPNPVSEFRAMELDTLNQELKNAGANIAFSVLSEDVQKSVKHYVSIKHKFVKNIFADDQTGPVGTFHVLSPIAMQIIADNESVWTGLFEEVKL